jgi:large subunit ribosomal protein L22
MQVHAILKNVPMSPQKVREVVRQIQGLPALHAQAVLAVVPRKSARFVAKALASAIANAENLRQSWDAKNLHQKVTSFQSLAETTHNRKRASALRRHAARYESFLDSSGGLAPEKLWVKEAHAATAMRIKRFTPKARGSAGPIIKRRSHIKITLSDE